MQASSQKTTRSPFQGFLPFFWLALALIWGILLADWAAFPAWVWVSGAIISVLTLMLGFVLPKSLTLTHLLRRWTQVERRLPGAVLAAVFFLGGWRYAGSRLVITPAHAAYFNDRGLVEVIGTVIQPPDYRDNSTNLTIQVKSLIPKANQLKPADKREVNGLVLVQAQPGADWAYGDLLRVTGELQTPFEAADFSYRDYLARKGVLSLMPYARVERLKSEQGSPIKAALYSLRVQGYDVLQTLFLPPESNLLAGILLGRDEGLSSELQEAFRRTGTTHIIAISGFNIAILAGLFSSIFTRLMGRKWGALTAIASISGYTILVGANPAVVRAAIMGGVGVFGGMFGRRQNGLNSLGLTALFMMLADPNLPWDVGFQLSVAATLGLVLYAQPLEEYFLQIFERRFSKEQAQNWIGPVSEFFLFTIAAQIMTLPIMIFHFKGVSWLALIANPLILPVQSLAMILGGLTMLSGMILPGLGQIMAVFALPFVRYTIRMVTWLAHWPGRDLIISNFNILWLMILYALLFLFTLFPKEQRQIIQRKIFSPTAGLVILAGLVIFTWNRVLTRPDGRLHLTLLDAEGTILIQAPDGKAVLVGGGPSPSSLTESLSGLLPAGDRSLGAVIVGSTTRADLNALTGTLGVFDAEMALWGVDPEANQTTASVYALLIEKNAPIQVLRSGQSLELGQGIYLKVLWVGERGALMCLEWGDFSALIPTGKVEDNWLKITDRPDVLLLPDDLSAENVPLWQVNLWAPSMILAPLDESDLPLQGEHEIMTLFEGYPVVSTFEHGWVRVVTDGEQIWVNSER